MSLSPGDTIGIVGGGQLGRMLAMAAARLGFQTIVLDPQPDSPASQCSNDQICAPFDDANALNQLASRCSVITYEFENVDLVAIRKLEDQTPCRPNPLALEVSQDRLLEKTFFNDLGIETAPYVDISRSEDLEDALRAVGGGGILKTRRFGYDGKGQVRVSGNDAAANRDAHSLIEAQPCILEGMINFEREISVIAARSLEGEIQCFDPAENVHKNGILHTSTVPAAIDGSVTLQAKQIAEKILEKLGYVGVIGIEFFAMKDGSLIANEYAPRVHNSGHWTEAACVVSQFEQHIRAISGLRLGSGRRHSDCMMQNLIGTDVEHIDEIVSRGDTMLHIYGKNEVRDGRKMGHFTSLIV